MQRRKNVMAPLFARSIKSTSLNIRITSVPQTFPRIPLDPEAITMLSILWSVVFMTVLGIFVRTTQRGRKSRDLPLPPGPRPMPIIGNLRDLPNTDEQDWQHWMKHKAIYGKIVSRMEMFHIDSCQ